MKKIVALIFALAFIAIIPMEAVAAEVSKAETIQRNIEMCELYFPGCTVTVDDNDELHVFVPYDYLADLPRTTTTSRTMSIRSKTSPNVAPGQTIKAQSHYAPEGGIYKAYVDPAWKTGGQTAYWPVYAKFFGKDEAQSMLHFRNDKEMFEYIVKNYVEGKVQDLIDKVLEKFLVKIPVVGIMLAVQLKVYEYVEWIKYADFWHAINDSSKSKVYCVTMNGLPGSLIPLVHTYSPWNSDYATDPCADNYRDQADYNAGGPTFYRGSYK